MFNSLKIKDFRMLQDQEIILGNLVTVLAGRNSTGKSTILGMLANSSEIKKKVGETYLNGAFRAEFSELFKGSKNFDVTGSNRFELITTREDGQVLEDCHFRTSWQKYKDDDIADRFRIIPRRLKEDGKLTEAKLEYPVLYLGLSRLFPVGEALDESISR